MGGEQRSLVWTYNDLTDRLEEGDSFDSSDDDENCFDTCENNSFVSLNDNDGLESFTFGDSSLSNEHGDDLHEMLCGDDDMNVDATLCDLNDVEIVNFLDNYLDDAMYIHNLIGKDRSEGVENENIKEEVEDKKKTRNESVREEVEEKDTEFEYYTDFSGASMPNNNTVVSHRTAKPPERNCADVIIITVHYHAAASREDPPVASYAASPKTVVAGSWWRKMT
nr:hypothetical protein Iba_chr03aCG3150 [Ipomoea batatas]